jgi:hypothetical protein
LKNINGGSGKTSKKKKSGFVFLTLGTKMHKYIHIYNERQKAWETAFFPPPALEREREGAALKALLKLDQLFLFFFKFLSFFFGEHRPFFISIELHNKVKFSPCFL